jgi:type II secretory ATPase GspE/PulE/Tfp pilus assembly ATPase PilB-like protein
MQAALTRYLILSIVHVGSSKEAITHLHDFVISKYLIDSCVRCVISQELMRLKCKFCQDERKCDKCFDRK